MANESGSWIMHGLAWEDSRCIHTVEEAMAYINKVGFLPLFKNDVLGFSLEEWTSPDYWWSDQADKDPWAWREVIARSGQIAYGKFFDKKAGFISKEWLPYFANYKRCGYDFDALWDDEKASLRQKKIMDLFLEENEDAELFSYEIKQKAGFGKGAKGSDSGEKNFEGTITDLMMNTYLLMTDFRKRKNKKGVEYGWDVAIYATPEHVFGRDLITASYEENPEVSGKRIYDYVRSLHPEATDKQIKKLIH